MHMPFVPRPSRELVVSVAIGTLLWALAALVFVCFAGCAGSSALLQCKVDAVDALLESVNGDPMRVTPYDGVELVQRVKACHRAADAGAP